MVTEEFRSLVAELNSGRKRVKIGGRKGVGKSMALAAIATLEKKRPRLQCRQQQAFFSFLCMLEAFSRSLGLSSVLIVMFTGRSLLTQFSKCSENNSYTPFGG